MIPLLVFTSDKYLPALRPFAYLFNRYWSAAQTVTVVGFAEPEFELPSNFQFHSLGDVRHYPINHWSNAVMDYLEVRTDISHFIFMLEDYWVTRPVNISAIKMLYDYALQFRNVLKIDTGTDRLYAGGMKDYNHCGYLDLVLSDYNSPYHMSLMAGIFNKELLLRFMLRNESPWDLEIYGTSRLATARDEVLVLGTRNFPLRHTLAHRGGDIGKTNTSELDPFDVDALTHLGYLPY